MTGIAEQVTPGAVLALIDAVSTVLSEAPGVVAGDPDVRAAAVALAEQITAQLRPGGGRRAIAAARSIRDVVCRRRCAR